MQRTSLLQAGHREDSSPAFISGGFGYCGTGLRCVVAQWPGGLRILPLLGLQLLMVRLGRGQGLVCDQPAVA